MLLTGQRADEPEAQSAHRTRRLVSIDALRGAAALYVVAFHLYCNPTLNPAPTDLLYYPLYWLHYGYTGVGLFLVISGFCIHLPCARGGPGSHVNFWAFWKRRLWRLYPPYLAAIIASLGVGLIGGISFHGGLHLAVPPPPYPDWDSLFLDVGAHLLMLQTIFPSTIQVFDPPLWSLALEEQLYLLYLPWLRCRREIGIHGGLSLALVVCLVWKLFPVAGLEDVWLTQAPARWFEWCLGAFAAEAYCGRVKLPGWCSSLKFSLAFLVIGAASGPWFGDQIFGIGYFVLVNYAVHRELREPFSSGGIFGRLASIGVWSYSLYLIHMPLNQLGYGILALAHRAQSPAAQLLFLPPFMLVGSWIFFQLIEKHFVNSSRRLNSGSSRSAVVPQDNHGLG